MAGSWHGRYFFINVYGLLTFVTSLVAPGFLGQPGCTTLSQFYGVCERSQPLSRLNFRHDTFSIQTLQAVFFFAHAEPMELASSTFGSVLDFLFSFSYMLNPMNFDSLKASGILRVSTA